MDIAQLIDRAVRELENTSRSSDMVGNQPCYPMYLAVSSKEFQAAGHRFRRKLGRAWPQAIGKIAMSAYTVAKDGSLELRDIQTGDPVEQRDMQQHLDQIKQSRGVFYNMMKWCFYNIIDTTGMTSVEEFTRYYQAQPQFQGLILDNCQAMLLVLLDDSMAGRSTAGEIKKFLAQNNTYDGTVILSNRTRSNTMYTMPELLRVAASVVMLSNNITISSSTGSEEYSRRTDVFYNNHMNTVSYSMLERPNRKVALQMMDTFLRRAQEAAEKPAQAPDIQTWKKYMGESGGKLQDCEELLERIHVDVDMSVLQYMPLRSCDEKSTFPRVTYDQFCACSYQSVLEQFIEEYTRSLLRGAADMNQCILQFRDRVASQVTAAEMLFLTDDSLNQIFSQLYVGNASRGLPVDSYVQQRIFRHIRQDLLYPGFCHTLEDLRADASQTKKILERVYADLKREFPVDGFDSMGDLYSNMVLSYLKTDKGAAMLRQFLRPGVRYDEMLFMLLEMVRQVAAENRDHFALPFGAVWAMLLKLAGDSVYREILNALDSDIRNQIHLYGNYPIEERMQVYLFHTADAKGENTTELYSYVSQAYQGIPNVQFYNTGFDDAIETVWVFDCSGDKLLV